MAAGNNTLEQTFGLVTARNGNIKGTWQSRKWFKYNYSSFNRRK